MTTVPTGLRTYLVRVATALSVLLNVVTGGSLNQTFSARNWERKRNGKANLRDGYCTFRGGEILLLNVHISPHKNVGSFFNHDPLRNRKLLLHKKEIIKLKSNVERKGMSLIPLNIYLKGSWIKLTIGLGKGKKLYDKRQADKQKNIKREINSILKDNKL